MLKVKEDGLNIIFMLIQNFKELVFEFFYDELKLLLPSVWIGPVCAPRLYWVQFGPSNMFGLDRKSSEGNSGC